MTKKLTRTEINEFAAQKANDLQLPKLAQMLKMGWQVTKLIEQRGKIAISLSMKGTQAWLTPTAQIVRAKPGCKCAYINTQTLEAA